MSDWLQSFPKRITFERDGKEEGIEIECYPRCGGVQVYIEPLINGSPEPVYEMIDINGEAWAKWQEAREHLERFMNWFGDAHKAVMDELDELRERRR